MTEEQNITYTNAMIACALIKAQGMTADNMQRAHLGQSMSYIDKDFFDLIEEYGIHHNAVISKLIGKP